MEGSDQQHLSLLGVSVHYMQTQLLDEVLAAGHTRASKIGEIENLQEATMGVFRRKGASFQCPLDGKKGAAYVHCLHDEDHVGIASFMLSYSWR